VTHSINQGIYFDWSTIFDGDAFVRADRVGRKVEWVRLDCGILTVGRIRLVLAIGPTIFQNSFRHSENRERMEIESRSRHFRTHRMAYRPLSSSSQQDGTCGENEPTSLSKPSECSSSVTFCGFFSKHNTAHLSRLCALSVRFWPNPLAGSPVAASSAVHVALDGIKTFCFQKRTHVRRGAITAISSLVAR
jgi:hypothetical protein